MSTPPEDETLATSDGDRELYDRFSDGERVWMPGTRRIGTVVKSGGRIGVMWDPTSNSVEWMWTHEWGKLKPYQPVTLDELAKPE